MTKTRSRKIRGGFMDNISNTLSSWGSSLSQGASNLWEKTKNSTMNLTGTTTSNVPANYNYSSTQPPMNTPSYGGKSRRRNRMRGGYKDNSPTTGLAVNAASFSGKTALPHNWVGGKTRRRKKTHKRRH